MPTILNQSITPGEVNCGDRVQINVQVSFNGPPRDVTVMCEIESPCHFSTGASRISIRRTGPSPQSFRFVEQVRCGAGTFAPQIRITASDTFEAADQRFESIVVHC
jgi:hypothetical protein